MSKAIAPSKIIISGEHFVVEGEPALVAAVDLFSEVIVEERYDEYIRIESIDLDNEKYVIKGFRRKIIDKAGNKNSKKILRPILATVLKTLEYGEKEVGLDIYINSKIPISAGLGSSASVAVATSAAVSKEIGLKTNKEIIWKCAFEAERIVHKNPSGVDVTISTYGGMIFYKKGERPVFLNKPSKAKFLIGYIGKRENTGKIVEEVLKLKRTFPLIINPLYISAGNLTTKIAEYLQKDDLKNAGKLININHEILSALNVSTSKLDLLVNIARKKGAYGAKLTGAGKGGGIIALVDDENLEKVKENLEKKAKKVFVVSIINEGVKIV